jgi:hypothetical protein
VVTSNTVIIMIRTTEARVSRKVAASVVVVAVATGVVKAPQEVARASKEAEPGSDPFN